MAKPQAVATKAKPTPAPAPEPAPSQALSTGLPSFLAGYKGPIGTEGIDNDDVTIPRLKVAQAISDEVKEGLVKEGSLFLNVTGQALWNPGDAPLLGLIVAQSKEYILWRPRDDEGGGMLARAKPVRDAKSGRTRYAWDKPDQTFEVKVGGKIKVRWTTNQFIDEDGLGEWGSEIPDDKDSGTAATAHHNYLVLLPRAGNVVAAISLSRSGVKVAKNLNAAIKMGDSKYPLPCRKFTFVTVDDVGANGDKYKNWQFKPAGYLGEADAELAKMAMTYFAGFASGNYAVDRSDEVEKGGASDNDEVPF